MYLYFSNHWWFLIFLCPYFLFAYLLWWSACSNLLSIFLYFLLHCWILKVFKHSRIKSFIRYMIHKYFLPVVAWLFISLTLTSTEEEKKIDDVFSLTEILFLWILLLTPGHKDFCLFQVLLYVFKFDQVCFSFYIWYEVWHEVGFGGLVLLLLLFFNHCSIIPAPFIEDCIFSFHFSNFSKTNSHFCMYLFLDFILIDLCVFLAVPCA